MDCYAVQNPANGQKCNDDVYGPMAYNAADDTWELDNNNPANVFDQAGNWISTKLGGFNYASISPNSATNKVNGFLQKNALLILGAGIFIIAFFVIRGKKK